MGLTDMITAGGSNPLLLFTFALALGALHGLEPGHSKTMMAAYIVAIRGTVGQAVLLGAAAAFSHTIIVWALAWVALTWGNELIGEELEPVFMVISGVIVLGIAAWMLWRGMADAAHQRQHSHAHEHAHGHHHHSHGEHHGGTDGLDAHARAHASQIEARLSGGRIGTGQTILFGLSGGLIPCPAAITVFILCLHLGQAALGVTLVGAFSLGLAATLIAVGVVAALGLRFMTSQGFNFESILKSTPWVSAALVAAVGLIIVFNGLSHFGVEAASH
ncbi:MAG: nickel/cobalt efflux transporter [Pseudomonadota bacterium]